MHNFIPYYISAKFQILDSIKQHSYFKVENLDFDKGLYTRCNFTSTLKILNTFASHSLLCSRLYVDSTV